jgi:WD40 repeat protein
VAAIFISHSSHDNAVAGEIMAWLKGEGYERVFLDFDKDSGLDAGKEWEQELYEKIRRCQAIILLVTPKWVESKWCFVEFAQARALGKVIFPVLVTAADASLLGPVLNTVQAEQWNDDGRRHLAGRLQEVAGEIAKGYHWESGGQPWPGIMSFEFEDRAVFFGRDPEIRLICERLEARRVHGGARLVMIVGASGSGKSSVLKAGVLPYLGRNRGFKTLSPFRPGAAPVLAFAKVLAEALGRPSDFQAIAAELRSDPDKTIANAIEALRIGPAREAVVLIAIDQFEELFMLATREERDALLRILTVASAPAGDRPDRPSPVMMVGTVRSDLLGEILKGEQFSLPHEVFTLANLPQDRISSIIEGPADVAAVTLEAGLVKRILDDVGSSLDALPLLAFTLRKLYAHGGGDHKLTIDDYEALGDRDKGLKPLEDAVRRTVEDTLAAASPSAEESEALRVAFVGPLVRVNSDGVRVRRPAHLEDMGKAQGLIKKLADARLLSIRTEGGSDVVEVAHESLFKVWPDLASWLDADQNFLVGLRQIEDARRQWSTALSADKDRALMEGLLLENAREWWRANPKRLKDVEDFVVASIDKADRKEAAQKRNRLLQMAGALAVAAVFAVIATFAWLQRDKAEAATSTALEEANNARAARDDARLQSARAVDNETRHLASLGETAVATGHPMDGVKLGLAAWPQGTPSNRPQLDKALRVISKAISDNRMPKLIMRHDSAVVEVIPLAEDRLLARSYDTVSIWDVRTGRMVGSAMKHERQVLGALPLEDGHVLSWCADGHMYVWDTRSDKPVREQQAQFGYKLSPIKVGEHILFWQDGELRKWTWRTGASSSFKIRVQNVDGALPLSDGNRLLSWASGGILRLWDLAADSAVGPVMQHGTRVDGARALPNGRFLSWSDDPTLCLWDPDGPSGPIVMRHGGRVLGALPLSDTRLVSWSEDGTLRLWNMKTDQEVVPPMRHGGAVIGAIALPASRVLSWSVDGSLRIWDIERGIQVGADMRHDGGVYGARLLPDGRILSWGPDNALKVWNADTTGQAGPTMHHDSYVLGAMVTDQGIVSWSNDQTIRLWPDETVMRVGAAMRHGAGLEGAMEISRGRILSWSGDGKVRVWDGQSGALGQVAAAKGAVAGAVAISDDRIALWGETLVIWDLTRQNIYPPSSAAQARIRGALVLPPEGPGQPQRILSWSHDGTLQLWNALTRQPIGVPIKHDEQVVHVHKLQNDRILMQWYSGLQVRNAVDGNPVGPRMPHAGVLGATQLPDGRLLTWSQETLKQWSPTGEPIPDSEKDVKGRGINPNSIARVLPLPAGQLVLVPNQDDQMPVVEASGLDRSGPGLRLRPGQYVRGAQDLSKGRILSWDVNGTLQVWDPRTQSQVATAWHDEVWGAFEMRSGRILSWSKDGALRLWQLNLPNSSLFDLSCALLPDKELETVQKRYGSCPISWCRWPAEA